MDGDQISMFEMLGMDETPEIPPEQQKKGTKGWVIEIEAVFKTENGYKKNAIGVTTKRVQLRKDTVRDRYGLWQCADTIEDGCRGDGWSGSCRKLYTVRPTWRELQEFVRERYKGLWDIVFVMKDGNAMINICDFNTKEKINGQHLR